MNELVCPQCATVNTYVELTPHAANFCTECDFPLFWDQMLVAVPAGTDASDGAMRRLPGVAGHDSLAVRPCPDVQCAEPNPLVGDRCIRCGGLMVLPPPPDTVFVDHVEIVLEEPPFDWVLLALVLLVSALVIWLVALGIDYRN